MGYSSGEKHYEEIIEMVDREAEGSDSLEVRCHDHSAYSGADETGVARFRRVSCSCIPSLAALAPV